jgi:hypothetical protein
MRRGRIRTRNEILSHELVSSSNMARQRDLRMEELNSVTRYRVEWSFMSFVYNTINYYAVVSYPHLPKITSLPPAVAAHSDRATHYYFFSASATIFPISFLSTAPAASPNLSQSAFITTPCTLLLLFTLSSRLAMISDMLDPIDSADGVEGR